MKKYVLKHFYDEDKKCFVRNEKDRKMDISLLGLIYPFNMFSSKEKKIQNTVERINLSLRTYTGGYQRFENDHYMGGNPWVISNLWMANYYLETGEKKKAKETFDFVIKTAGKHYFLGEQVNNDIITDSMEDLVNDNFEKEENIIINNPNTGDNSIKYLGLLVISGVMLIRILRKMQ